MLCASSKNQGAKEGQKAPLLREISRSVLREGGQNMKSRVASKYRKKTQNIGNAAYFCAIKIPCLQTMEYALQHLVCFSVPFFLYN